MSAIEGKLYINEGLSPTGVVPDEFVGSTQKGQLQNPESCGADVEHLPPSCPVRFYCTSDKAYGVTILCGKSLGDPDAKCLKMVYNSQNH